ncbi:MAG: EpsG family protein [Bacteroidaceae bacterium]|nr:EpsG family protein [Bacteroidaceae bacterium]
MFPALMLTVFLCFYMGLRPVSHTFGDTVNYAYNYKHTFGQALFNIDFEEEWLWDFIMLTCKKSAFTVNMWFLVIEIGYLGFVFFGLRRLLHENPWMAMMFFLSAFSTFSFGTNGIRNGLACSMVIFAFAIAANKNFGQLVIAGVVLVLAFGIHRSTALPIIAFLVASYLIKSPKLAIGFWVASIGLSLVLGSFFTNFFMGLGFDDRMTSYATSMEQHKEQFSQTGFRWDFLLYSAMPVWLTWYVCKKVDGERALYGETQEEIETGVPGAGRIADAHSMRVFYILSTTYMLANSFWVMVNKAAFSNRFAYLSWFLYPVVIAYAVIRLHIWEDQDKKAALILVAHAGFTLGMYLIGKLF